MSSRHHVEIWCDHCGQADYHGSLREARYSKRWIFMIDKNFDGKMKHFCDEDCQRLWKKANP